MGGTAASRVTGAALRPARRSGPGLVFTLVSIELRLVSGSMSDSHLSLAPDWLEAVLETACATLIALQLLRASAADDAHATRRLTHEIQTLRQAIAELRAAGGADAAVGAGAAVGYGFVLDEGFFPHRSSRRGWATVGPGTDLCEVAVG